MRSLIGYYRARKDPGFAQYLEALADSENGKSALGRREDTRHDRSVRREGARTQVVTVGGTTGQNHRVNAGKVRFVVPKLNWFCPRRGYGRSGLPVVNRSGKGDDTDTHYRASTFTTSSTTKFASTSSATR